MNHLTCIAIDDEPLALQKLVDYIDKIPFLEFKGGYHNALEAIPLLQNEPIDLIFLDIQMPEIKGTQFVSILKNKPQIIFTTAYDQYALEGFSLDATDYLLKPIAFDRFLDSAQKALDRAAFSPNSESADVQGEQGIVFIKSEHKWIKVQTDFIKYIEGLKDYLSIYVKEERILTLQSFSTLLEKISNDSFVRIHKSYVVNVKQIDEIEKARVRIGEKWIPISDTYRTGFFKLLEAKGLI